MSRRVNYEIEKAMDNAIEYLSMAFRYSGHNEKPVLIHSVRVGLSLFNNGYSKKVILAGILHDILEDTGVSYEQLVNDYGVDIAKLVSATSFDSQIHSKTEQNVEMFLRCKSSGFDALLVKCADISDNIDVFVPSKENGELQKILIAKYHNFISISEDVLSNEEIFIELKNKVKLLDCAMEKYKEKNIFD